MSCCKIDLGLFPHNEDINLGITAPDDGEYKFSFEAPNYTKFAWKKVFSMGDYLVLPKGLLNEDFLYKLTIRKPDGTLLDESTTDGLCPNFIFKTYIETTAQCGNFCDGDTYDS